MTDTRLLRPRLLALLAALSFGTTSILRLARRSAKDQAEAASRGRFAVTPSEIPRRGWFAIARRTFDAVRQDRLLSVAGGVTFFALLALAPAVAATVAIYSLLFAPSSLSANVAPLLSALPSAGVDLIQDQIHRLASPDQPKLSVTLAVSLAVALWSANAGMKAVFDALNVIYSEKEKRSFLALNLLSLRMTIGAIVIFILAMFVIALVPAIPVLSPVSADIAGLFALLRWPVLFVFTAAGIAILYRYGPSRTPSRWAWLTPGAVLAAALWLAASWVFSWYVSTLGNYSAAYGSLSAIVVFMTWLWISTIMLLVGAQLNAELERQTSRDTTIGPEKPRGRRGASVADDLGD